MKKIIGKNFYFVK